MSNTGRCAEREGPGARIAASLVFAALASVAAGLLGAGDPPAAPAARAPAQTDRAPAISDAKGPCTLVGKVPVLPRKAAGASKGAYAAKGGERVEPADPPASAVWMVGDFAPADPAKTKPAILAQEGLQFRPALLVVQAGTPVSFPNRDPIYHSVFSYASAKKLDLGRYRPGEEPPPVVFDKAGCVPLRCEVHDHMYGVILVVDSPHFASTDAAGAFRLEGLPSGRHTFRIWLSPKETVERTVELKPGENAVDWTKAP